MLRQGVMMSGLLVLVAGLSVWLVGGERSHADGPSSSLYVNVRTYDPQLPPGQQNEADTLAPAIKRVSLCAVKLPAPRFFKVHDLVSIVVRESAENTSDASLETEKESNIDAAVEAFIDLKALLEARVRPTALAGGAPTVDVSLNRDFEGDGAYERKDTMTMRIQAEVIDIKPNGNLVLEARKYLRSDKESVSIVLSGVCRAFDVNANNEVLSTHMHDLRVVKEHEGEIRKATKKGLITQFLDALINI